MNDKGFFGSLFDFSFTEFITTSIIKVLYILAVIGSAIAAIGLLISGFASGKAAGVLFAIVISPIAFILYVILARVWMEVILVLFRIAENTGKLVEQNEIKNMPTGE